MSEVEFVSGLRGFVNARGAVPPTAVQWREIMARVSICSVDPLGPKQREAVELSEAIGRLRVAATQQVGVLVPQPLAAARQ